MLLDGQPREPLAQEAHKAVVITAIRASRAGGQAALVVPRQVGDLVGSQHGGSHDGVALWRPRLLLGGLRHARLPRSC